MTAEQLRKISVIDPISPAIERVKVMLFTPFDLRKWFVIGFCAWLAYLGSGQGGSTFNFGRGFNQSGRQPFYEARNYVINNLSWLIPAAIVTVVLMIIIGVVLIWLSSRGQFMFLHCVAQNKAEVKVPWHKYRQQANSLFLFRIVVGIVSFVFFALFIGVIVFFIILSRGHTHTNIPGIFTLILIFLLLLIAVPVGIAFTLLLKFTHDFVVPIMYLRACTCLEAWRELLTILSVNKLRFTLYILFQIVIAMAIGGILMAAMCITCCCAACILSIPYIGTVLLLPLLIFKRAYSLCYFRQFGPSFDVFSPEIVQPDLLQGT